MKQITIEIIECRNGFVITKKTGIPDTCAVEVEVWVANEAKQVADIIYNILPKG